MTQKHQLSRMTLRAIAGDCPSVATVSGCDGAAPPAIQPLGS